MPRNLSKINQKHMSHQKLYMNVHKNFIHQSQKLQIIQMSINNQIKQIISIHRTTSLQ